MDYYFSDDRRAPGRKDFVITPHGWREFTDKAYSDGTGYTPTAGEIPVYSTIEKNVRDHTHELPEMSIVQGTRETDKEKINIFAGGTMQFDTTQEQADRFAMLYMAGIDGDQQTALRSLVKTFNKNGINPRFVLDRIMESEGPPIHY